LVERQAATRAELEDQRQRLGRAQSDLDSLDLKRRSLVGPEDRERVLARIREAEAALAEAATVLRQTEIRSPEDGILYSMTLRPGGFYNTGELVGQVGRLDKVRVRVLVDEPDLGRLQVGQPVRVVWDALPGVSWQGVVGRLPSAVEMSGARSVGEVLCTIDNPGHRLLPNVTVDAEIRTGAAENALVIPREAVLREGERPYALLADDRGIVARHPVTLGIQDVNRVQVLEGLSENQVVLLPSEGVVSPGQKVRPKVQP
jgi:HlyD family secretion protein